MEMFTLQQTCETVLHRSDTQEFDVGQLCEIRCSVCVSVPPSPLQKTDRLLRHCPEERVVQHSSLLMQAYRGGGLPAACQPQAVILRLWWVIVFQTLNNITDPPSPCFMVCRTHSGSGMVWAAFVWSCAMKNRQDQWGRHPAPDQTTSKSKPSSPPWKPVNEGRMGSTKGMAVAGWAHELHSPSNRIGNSMVRTFMYTLWWTGYVFYLMLWTHGRINGNKTYQIFFSFISANPRITTICLRFIRWLIGLHIKYISHGQCYISFQ